MFSPVLLDVSLRIVYHTVFLVFEIPTRSLCVNNLEQKHLEGFDLCSWLETAVTHFHPPRSNFAVPLPFDDASYYTHDCV